MLLRILILFGFYISFAQNEFSPEIANQDSLLSIDDIFFENNNIGDPIIFHTPKFSSNSLLLNHISQNVRKVDFLMTYFSTSNTKPISNIYYESCYNEGGLIKGRLSRPVGKKMRLNFFYNNLSSKGFYNRQKNKYSHLFLSLDFFSKKIPYASSVSLTSLNAQYEQNGGLVSYNPNIELDLLETFLTSATTNIKKRVLDFTHYYLVNNDLKIQHKCSVVNFEREYIDPNPASFYYSLTPLDYLIESNYNLSDFIYTVSNNIGLVINNLNFLAHHNYYHNNSLDSNTLAGDFILSFSALDLLSKKMDLDLSYCLSGYNKNNFLINFLFDKKNHKTNHLFKISYIRKKPDFFTKHYDNMFSFNWLDFSSVNTLSLNTTLYVDKRDFKTSLYINRVLNFFYFNEIAAPVQFNESLLYCKFNFTKSWNIGGFLFATNFVLQYFDKDVVSVPSVFYHQKIAYNHIFSDNLKLSASVNSSIFSRYYPQSFFPLTDVFYQQRVEKSKLVPFVSADIYLYKKNFSFGLIFDHIHSLFLDNNFLTPSYFLPNANFRFSINWSFID